MEVPSRINLGVGQKFVLRLKGLGSAGYTWDYTIEGNDRVVSISREMAGRPPAPPAGGPPPATYSLDELFTVQAHEPGRVLIHFLQRRPWEKDRPPQQEHVLEVLVD